MTEAKELQTDVLIIGGGMAGMRAAIEAHDRGAKATLVNKGAFGRDGGATWMAGAGYETALYPPDSVEQHIRDTILASRFLANQKIVTTVLKLSPQSVRELAKWGVRYVKDSKGRLEQWQMPGHRFMRSMRTTTGHPGPFFSRALRDQIRRRDIQVIEDVFTTDLLKKGDTVVGAVGIDLRDGEFRVMKAKSTILATGGAAACYNLNSNGNATLGDGMGMAYRAGGKLMDMEFHQFTPGFVIWPPNIAGSDTYKVLTVIYGYLLNRQGERFMHRYYPETMEWSRREQVARSIYAEVRARKGSPHGGVYLSIAHQPRNLLDAFLEFHKTDSVIKRIQESGIDLHHDAFEVGAPAHYTQGGCWVNEQCETSLDGLYAIGEVAGGLDGADRLGGNALPYCMGMGVISGRQAARRAQAIGRLEIDEGQMEELRKETFEPLERTQGVSPLEIKKKIRDNMEEYAKFFRNREGLETGLKVVKEIREKSLPNLWVSAKNKRYNLDWVEAMEVRNMTNVAEMTFRSALMRTESRGAHERSDYPKEDPGWLKNIIIQKIKGEMTFTTQPVEFTYYRPEDLK